MSIFIKRLPGAGTFTGPKGADWHEHFDVDQFGNILWGTTTVRLPGDKATHLMNWKEKPQLPTR